MSDRILVTSALPYANGHIHLGHLVEYLMTDIWARSQRASGRRCVYVCADDTHGTSIMIRARQERRSELELIAEMSAAHQRDFAAFHIRFDHYGSTHSEANRAACARTWEALRAGGYVRTQEVTQLFDPVEGVFLADRFVQGTCPRCGATQQWGDSCEKCLSTYTPMELVDPVSTLSGAQPVVRSAHHLLVEVERLHGFLDTWVRADGTLQPEIANYLTGFFLSGPLRDWDVSRPAPYFGFEIPDSPGDYWYVWFDAPLGYIGATAEWCERHGESLEDWWRSASTRIVHVIGKDIVYFHTLFWPAMLHVAGWSLPSRVQVHGFLTVNGEKMSKSRGTFVLARTYLEAGLDPTHLRYYYATKLGPRADDLDLDLDDFVARVNADLVGKLVNLASRTARFVTGQALPATYPEDGGLFAEGAAAHDEIVAAYEAFDFARVTRLVMGLADRANEWVARTEPWALAKDPARRDELVAACAVALSVYRQLVVYLSPILPELAGKTAALLGRPIERLAEATEPLVGVTVAPFERLLDRVDAKRVAAMIEASRASLPGSPPPADPPGPARETPAPIDEPVAPTCSIEDFERLDLRVARVTAAAAVAGAKKLVELTLDVGAAGTRTVFAGIKGSYPPERLVGRLVIVVANLAPRAMRFGTSEGMVVAAGPPGKADERQVFLLAPDDGAAPGLRVR
ncbi:MAG: methionine--tRNA ligase [Polyangiaceae bacterium]|nr:methionine--tRNA ligase [Polyangiaceae bacterium]